MKMKCEIQLATQCGPVLSGAAVANFVTLPNQMLNEIESIVAAGELQLLPLWQQGDRISVLLYRHSFLGSFLKKDAVSSLMGQFGYSSSRQESVLKNFQSRYVKCRQKGGEFPHELGLLLGFPPEDVIGYMVHRGRDYLLSGYWKVYDDIDYAKRKFQEYDAARVFCTERILQGISFKEVYEEINGRMEDI